MVRRYDASSVDAPDALEHVRRHPGMYLGDVDATATLQCLVEVVQNATDEVRECGAGRVFVRVDDQGTVVVADDGRGIPVEVHPKTGVSTLETVLTRIGAGAKSGAKNAYGNRTIGVHGVGVSAVCALSERMTVWTRRSGRWWIIELRAGRVTGRLRKSDPPPRWNPWGRGTIVSYSLDKSILKDPLPLGSVRHYCNIARHFDALTIDYADPERRAVLAPRTPASLLAIGDSETLLGPFSASAAGVRAALAWTNAPDFSVRAHVAGAPVPSGTHVRGLEEAVAAAFATVRGRDSRGLDPKVGLRAVIDVDVDQPSFSGQAKSSLRTPEVRRRVVAALAAPLAKFLRGNAEMVGRVLEHAARIGVIDARHQEARQLARAAGPRGSLAFPKGAVVALSIPPGRRELYIVEGNSARGTAKKAKMPHQEILPMRGKMANVINRQGAITDSEMIGGILRMIGFDPRRPDRPLRVARVIFLADADEDGAHITVLLMTIIQRVIPRLLGDGRVFIVDAPLFEAMTRDGKMVAGNSLSAMERAHGRLTHVNRMKGWGGCEPELLRQYAFAPETRTLLRLAAPSAAEARGLAELMGADSGARKRLLMGGDGAAEDRVPGADRRGPARHQGQ